MRTHHLVITATAALLGIGSFVACGFSNEAFDGGFGGNIEGPGPGPGTGGFGNSATGPGGGGALEAFNYSEHCGVAPTCVPGAGDGTMCVVDDGMGGSGGGSAGGAGGADGGSGPGGMGGSANGAGGGTTGSGGYGGMNGSGGDGGAPDTTVADCRLTYDDSGATITECVETEVGIAEINAPCIRSAQCGAGMACVATEGGNTSCQPYCCGDVEACPDDLFCALAPVAAADLPDMLDSGDVKPIPVCIQPDDCDLGGGDNKCQDGEVCTVVRAGITSCVKPGPGLNGDACPCAEGHFCDIKKNTCLQLCETNTQGACPEGFSCQGGVGSVPAPWGTCVGTY